MPDLLMGLTNYFLFYNSERLHQSLGYVTPDTAYRTGAGGVAQIVDKFGVDGGAARKNWGSAIQLQCEQDIILN